jgi:hypothetical protein
MDGIYAALNSQARPTGKWTTYKANSKQGRGGNTEGNRKMKKKMKKMKKQSGRPQLDPKLT